MSSLATVRKWLRPLQRTPVHPQWLVKRGEETQRLWVAGAASGRVLDIGSADGHVRRWLKECDYIALDYPATAQGMYGTRPDLFADGAALPFPEDSFDTVLLLDVLEHVRDARGVLDEIARVLKPHGRLLLSVPFLYPLHDAPHDYRRYTAPGLVSAVRRAGLSPDAPRATNQGLEAAALLAAIACAEAIWQSWRTRSWQLVFSPLLVAAIPAINVSGWLAARMAPPGSLLSAGHLIDAYKRI